MIKTAGVLGILLVGSFFDMKERKIPILLLLAGGAAAAVLFLMQTAEAKWETALLEAAFSLLPGTGMLLLSFVSGEKVGRGDGFLLLVLGALEGAETVCLTFGIGLFLQSVFAVGLLIAKKADKQTCIPFVPFLLAARSICLFV